ncbi:MAG TPA: ABC transporter ATP-binding protein [Actinocrinis sp.]
MTAVPPPAIELGDPVLEIQDFCVDYGLGPEAVRAVTNASFTLRRGEVLGLAGESGSGKSTLAYGATRLLRAPGVITGGRVLFHSRDGRAGDAGGDDFGRPEVVDLLDADAAQLARIRWSQLAMVFQSAMHALNPVARIERQLTDVLRRHRPEMSAAERRGRTVEMLRMVGITEDRLRAYPHELSGGMRQRVMIAMALILEPQVVIMDEPTTALDVVTQREILEELASLRARLGFAVVFITHDLSLLLELADSIAIMYAGRIVEYAPAQDLFHAPRHPYSQGLLNSFPALHGDRVRMSGIPGSPPSLRAMPSGCAFHPRCQFAMDRCSTDEPVLMPPAIGSRRPRTVACWKQDGKQPPPESLALPDPATASAAVPPAAAPAAERTSQISVGDAS